ESGADLTLVRRKKRVVKKRTVRRGTAVAPAGRGAVAAPTRMNSTNPGAMPSGQNPAVDQGLRVGGSAGGAGGGGGGGGGGGSGQ
ncbi:MAG: hypothetical protein ICV73_25325, partial [Acetobacteraceae bacterium]|nr:hypothetical protein [Acetobacteraceae bacterium]